jgi:ribonuclease HI
MGYLKLNFDGASKENPSPTRYIGTIHNGTRDLLYIYMDFIGYDTNNGAEVQALEKGISIAIQANFKKIIVEGHSLIVIHILQKLQTVLDISKISTSWCLESNIENIHTMFSHFDFLIPSHIRRMTKNIFDHLANVGSLEESNQHVSHWNNAPSLTLMENYQTITLQNISQFHQ